MDTWPTIAEAMNHMRTAMGYSEWTLDEVRHNCKRAARESFPDWFGDRWREAYDIYYKGFEVIRQKRPLAEMHGASDLLQWLKQSNIPAFVVSNKLNKYLRLEVANAAWSDLFAGVAGAQDAEKDKPAREHVDYVLNGSGVLAGPDVWLVGDSEIDMLCARNAECTPVLVGTNAPHYVEYGATFACADCAVLLDLLKSLHD